MPDFSRLSAHWYRWESGMGGENIFVSTHCDDCTTLFATDDYSVHLRDGKSWWIVDTVNDRGQRHDDFAKLSTFDLAEKYLIWDWSSSARGIIGAERLGSRLYSQGFSPDIKVTPRAEGIAELRADSGIAILMEPYAAIFSHLMSKSINDIEQMVRRL